MRTGRRAVITGSTSGIGLGIARALAGSGCNLMLNGLEDVATIDALTEGLVAEFGVEVFSNRADLSDAKGCEALVVDAEARLGGIDVLVNNAGIQHVSPVETFPVDRWNAV